MPVQAEAKVRLRAKDRWQIFQQQCKKFSEAAGKDTPPSEIMNNYYKKYKADVEAKRNEREAWNEAIRTCITQATPKAIESKNKSKETEPLKIIIPTKKIALPPVQQPAIDADEIKQKLRPLLSEMIKKQEDRTSKRLQQLDERLQNLKLQQSIQQSIKKDNGASTSTGTKEILSALEDINEKIDAEKELNIDALTEKLDELNIDALTEKIGQKVNNAISKLDDKIDELRDAFEAKLNIELQKKPTETAPRDLIKLDNDERDEGEGALIKNKVDELEGICERMFPIRTKDDLNETCGVIGDKRTCLFESGNNCKMSEPGLIGKYLWGEKNKCVGTPESLALIPTQLSEYAKCKEEKGEPIPERYAKALEEKQNEDRVFKQLQQASKKLNEAKQNIQLLDRPRDLMQLPPVLQPETTFAPAPAPTPNIDAPPPQKQSEPTEPIEPKIIEPTLPPQLEQPEPQPLQLEQPEPQPLPLQLEQPEPEPPQLEQPEPPQPASDNIALQDVYSSSNQRDELMQPDEMNMNITYQNEDGTDTDSEGDRFPLPRAQLEYY